MPIALQPSTNFTTTLIENSTANRTLTLPNNNGFIASIQNTTPSTTTLTSAHTANRTISLPDRNCTLSDGLQRINETAQSAVSQVNIDFNIPSYVRRIVVVIDDLSVAATSFPIIRLGTASTIISTGYFSLGGSFTTTNQASTTNTTGFLLSNGNQSALPHASICDIYNIESNIWVSQCGTCFPGYMSASSIAFGRGNVTLSEALTRIRVTNTTGTAFSTGKINVFYE